MKPDARTYVPVGTVAKSHSIIVPYSELMTNGFIGTQALFGQRFDVMSTEAGVAHGALYSILSGIARVDYVGSLHVSALAEGTVAPTHIVNAVQATVFRDADIKSKLLGGLPRNAALSGASHGDFVKLQQGGYVHLRHLRQIGHASSRSFVAHATDMLGLPYVWGGTGGVGVDCSGLVQSALASVGEDAPRDADQQEASLGQSVRYEDRVSRDLLFWPGHVGIVVDGDQLLHANAYHMCVAVEAVTEAVSRIGVVRTVKRL